MTEQAELGAILSGEAETPIPTGEEAAPPAAETQPEPTPEPKPEVTEERTEPTVPIKALHEERRKRQEYERELSELRKKLEATPETKPNLFEDPDNWEKHLEERVNKRASEIEAKTETRFLQLCEQAARARHKDFEDVVQVFAEAAASTPGLADEARRAPDPAEFIYQAGLNLKRVKEAGSIEALIERAREEGRQEALKGRVTPQVPESLSEIAGAKGDRNSWSGPKPLSQLLPNI